MPYWQLSSVYFFYFATLGALLPYWGLYLQSLGFSPQAIGGLMSILLFTKLLGPNLWGWLADQYGRRIGLLRWGAWLGMALFFGVFFGEDFWWLLLVMAAFSFFWNAILPLLEALTFSHLSAGHLAKYSRIRLWGSVGFIVVAVGAGWLFHYQPLDWLPWVVAANLIGIWLATLVISEPRQVKTVVAEASLLKVLQNPIVMALIFVCILNQTSHSVYYTFYSIFLEERGYSRDMIGVLWAVGVIAEVLMFMYIHHLQSRLSLERLLTLSMTLTAIRWVMIAYGVESLTMLLIAQLLHAMSFGSYHVAAIQLFNRYFVGSLQGRGQALYSSLSFGLGGAIGALAGGFLWEGVGGVSTFMIAAGLAMVGTLLSWGWVERRTLNSDA